MLAFLLINVLALGKRTFWIARRDVRTMVFAGLLMAGYQVTFIVALNLANVTIGTLVTLCTVPIFAAVLARAVPTRSTVARAATFYVSCPCARV